MYLNLNVLFEGVPEQLREVARKNKPTVDISQNGDPTGLSRQSLETRLMIVLLK
jgi:hypothetical protein